MTSGLKRTCCSVLAPMFFLANVLWAQDEVLRAKIMATREFIIKQAAATDFRDSFRNSVLEYEGSLSTRCKVVDLDFDSVAVKMRILMPLEMNDKGMPISGSWKESVPGTACNEKRLYNVQVDATKKGLHFTPTYPGTAQGDPELQRDTLKNIETNLTIVAGVKKSCHAEVLDTQLVGPESTYLGNDMMSPWKESWEVRACGKLFTVPLKYIPDAHGTAISVGTSDIQAH